MACGIPIGNNRYGKDDADFMKIDKIVFLSMLFFLLFLFVLLIFSESEKEIGFVGRVLDGDTFELNNSKKVRLIGINSPERGEIYYDESRRKLKDLIEGKKVFMEKDKEEKDRYGRLLRYVYLEEEMVNLLMVENGYAIHYLFEPNTFYGNLFENAEKSAMESESGLWSFVSDDNCSVCLVLEEFNWNADGNDCKNPNGEWVSFRNRCDFDCNITGWTVSDSGRNEYKFEVFLLSPGSSFVLFSGEGNNTDKEIYWNRKGACPAVWNNDGDTLFLRDSLGYIAEVIGY